MERSDAMRLTALEAGNRRLQRIVTDQMLSLQMLKVSRRYQETIT